MAKWSEETTVKFVNEYILHECLWNIKNVLYKNKQARHSAYTTIKEEMGIPDFGVNEVITKIKNIRSTYAQEIRKINDSKQSGAGTDSVYKPSVKWFAILDDVLRGVNIENRKTETNMNTSSSTETKNHNSENNADQEACEQQRISRKRNLRGLNTLLDKVKVATTELKEGTPVLNEVTNEFEIFGKSVAVHLNALSLETALRAQNEIQNYLTKLRLQQLECTRSNSHSSPSETPCYVSPEYTTSVELPTMRAYSSSSHYSESPAPAQTHLYVSPDYTTSLELPTRAHSSQSSYSASPTIIQSTGPAFTYTSNSSNTAQFNNNTDILAEAVLNIPM